MASPLRRPVLQRMTGAAVRAGRRIPGLRPVLLWPGIAVPGYWLATLCAALWSLLLGGWPLRRRGGVLVAQGMPRWAFGRGGTTIGAVYLTRDNVSPSVLEHEAVHRAQWRRYGLAFPLLYAAAGQNARLNRFEVEAGLAKGGYGRR